MGLLRNLVLLPVKGPLDGTIWVARQLAEQVQKERNSPAVLRAALAEAERQLLAGEITEEVYDDIEEDLLIRLREGAV